jgi:hypothetical protein
MPLLTTELLKKLGSGVRPDGAQRRRGTSEPTVDFSELIASARAGKIRSDRPVRWEQETPCDCFDRLRPLIEQAIDRAEAAGASRLLIAHGNRLLSADVAHRSVSEVDSDGSSVLAISAEAVLFISEHEDSCGELEELDTIESGTRSAKRNLALGLGWFANRSLGEVVAASEARGGNQEA